MLWQRNLPDPMRQIEATRLRKRLISISHVCTHYHAKQPPWHLLNHYTMRLIQLMSDNELHQQHMNHRQHYIFFDMPDHFDKPMQN